MIFIVVSTGHFDPLIKECARLSSRYDFFGQIGSSLVVPPFSHVRTASPEFIQDKMQQAEMVISHGGAGMTAMLCRLKKKCIIIPKQKRYGEMNNLQVELGRKWGELGVGEFLLDVDKLEETILKVRATEYSFPTFPALGLEIQRIMGLTDRTPQNLPKIFGY